MAFGKVSGGSGVSGGLPPILGKNTGSDGGGETGKPNTSIRKRDQPQDIEPFSSKNYNLPEILPEIAKTQRNNLDNAILDINKKLKNFEGRRLKKMIPIYVARAKEVHELNDSEYRQLLKKFGIFQENNYVGDGNTTGESSEDSRSGSPGSGTSRSDSLGSDSLILKNFEDDSDPDTPRNTP